MTRHFAVVLTLIRCSKKQPKDKGCSDGNRDKVTYVADDDPKMNAAIERARATVDTFIAALKSQAGKSEIAVKMQFTDGKNSEHMWLGSVSFDGQKFHGIVRNEPEAVTNVKFGQKATVAPSEISDWMFVQNRKLIGGYTLRVLRESLSPAERADFDKSVPFTVD